MEIAKEMIRQQSFLKEWFEHANRQYTIAKDEYKDGFNREFDNLIEDGYKLAQMPKIDSLDLLCDITDGSPQNEYLATELKETWLIHLKEGDINHKLRFFNSLLDSKIISFKEHSEAYHLAHVLNWNMESNAIAGKQALKRAGYYGISQQEYPKTEDVASDNKPLQHEKLQGGRKYNDNLVKLFRGHTELINKLIGLTDNEIFMEIEKWSKTDDENDTKRKLIDNPHDYGNAIKFATYLKDENMISSQIDTFRKKFSSTGK